MQTPAVLVVVILLGVPPLTFLALSVLSKFFLQRSEVEQAAPDAPGGIQKGNAEFLAAIRQVVQKCSRAWRQETLDSMPQPSHT